MDLHEQGAGSRAFAIAAIVCVLLQAGLAPQISIAGGRVNFMIVLVCLGVFSGDPTRAVICGFCSGLFYDLSAAVPVGVMSLLLTVGSFALVHSAAGQTGGTPSARGITVLDSDGLGRRPVFDVRRRAAVWLWVLRARWASDGYAL